MRSSFSARPALPLRELDLSPGWLLAALLLLVILTAALSGCSQLCAV